MRREGDILLLLQDREEEEVVAPLDEAPTPW